MTNLFSLDGKVALITGKPRPRSGDGARLRRGPFLTAIAESWPSEHRESSRSALERPGQPAEIITTALYLASPASSYTTSSLIRVDGGLY